MKESKFTGNIFNALGVNIVYFLIIILSLGILIPFAITYKYRWFAKNTYIEGRRLKFIGSGVNLFGKWILWWFLTIITLGIYGLFVANEMRKWIIKNTIFA